MTNVLEKLRMWIGQSKDIYALLMMAVILIRSKENLLKRKFHALDHYIGIEIK